MAAARAEGKLTARQHQSGEHTIAELFAVLERHPNAATPSTPGGQ